MPNKVFAHKVCRWPFRKNQKQVNVIDDNCVKSEVLQSERNSFNWKTCYFFCGKVCVVYNKHPNSSKGLYKVGTLSLQTSILNKCNERASKCTDDVLRRVWSSIDLVASDAIYHGQCESNFLRKKVYLWQRGQKLNTTSDAPQITQRTNGLMNKQNCLQ